MGRAIRTERYRLVAWDDLSSDQDQPEYELYDYQDSSVETKNLAASRPQVVERLVAKLARYPKPVRDSRNKPRQPKTRAPGKR